MAVIGVTIGATFAVSLVTGPLLQQAIGVPGIFALTGMLALAGIALVAWGIPAGAQAVERRPSTAARIR